MTNSNTFFMRMDATSNIKSRSSAYHYHIATQPPHQRLVVVGNYPHYWVLKQCFKIMVSWILKSSSDYTLHNAKAKPSDGSSTMWLTEGIVCSSEVCLRKTTAFDWFCVIKPHRTPDDTHIDEQSTYIGNYNQRYIGSALNYFSVFLKPHNFHYTIWKNTEKLRTA